MSTKHLLLVIMSLLVLAKSISITPANESKETNPLLSMEIFATSNVSTALGCNGDKYGRDLNLKSCLEAFDYIPSAMTRELSFGQRDEGGNYDIELPRRYLSCECMNKQRSILTPAESFLSRWDLCHRARLEATTNVSISTFAFLAKQDKFFHCQFQSPINPSWHTVPHALAGSKYRG